MRNGRNLLLTGLICALYLAPAVVLADDFVPPPWPRGDPSAITAEWEFLTPATPLAPDGFTNVGIKGSGSVPGGTTASILGPGTAWGPGDGDGGWFFPDTGEVYIRLDNVDVPRPVKHIRVQVTHSPGLAMSIDTIPALNFAATGAVSSPVGSAPFGPTHTLFFWDMFPNPSWEQFRILVDGPGEIDQVLVDTICVPEPSALLACGAGLVMLRRRRRD